MERATKMQQRLALSATDQISTNSYHFLITSKQREYDIVRILISRERDSYVREQFS